MQQTHEVISAPPSRLWVWGHHADGQAGVLLQDRSPIERDPRLVALDGAKGALLGVASGFRHTLVLHPNAVQAFGFRKHGRLGDGGLVADAAQSEAVPVQFGPAVVVVAVSCGFGHSGAVSAEGGLYTWGYGEDGALGHGNLRDVHVPRRVAVSAPMAAVSCGGCHTVALTRDGVLYACGKEEAVAKELAGNTFVPWKSAPGAVTLVHAGNKSIMAVAQAVPTGVYYWGEDYSVYGAKKVLQAAYQSISRARIVQTQWTQIACEASSIAVGAAVVHYVQRRTVMAVPIGSSVGLARPVPGLPPNSIHSVASGYRTYFALQSEDVSTLNRDPMGLLRGPCTSCSSCPRYACRVETHVNSPTAFDCVRCGCVHSLHVQWEEVDLVEKRAVDKATKEEPPKVSLAPGQEPEWNDRYEQRKLVQLASAVDVDRSLSLEAAILAQQLHCKRLPAAAGNMRVYAVTDIHTDFRGNMKWLTELVEWAGTQFRNDAIIVAGDISHDMGIIETTLGLFKMAFGHVFHVCGNHELWVAPQTDTVKHAYHKLLEVLQCCEKLGVHTSAVAFGEELAVVPLLSWYEPQFVGATSRGAMEGFDMACRWPESDAEITTEMLQFNVSALKELAQLPVRRVVTFSHFLPRQELFFGWSALGPVMGSKRLDVQLRNAGSSAHVFGHSHMNVDRTIDGVRYIQHALGSNPHQRTQSSFPTYMPKQIV